MGIKRAIARNAVWNWAGMAAPLIAGFLVAPFLVDRLGQTTYGLWILVGSMAGYYGLLDLGIRDSVGRNIAFHLAKGDQEGVNSVLSTALAILCGATLIALVGTVAILPLFFHLFDVPPDQVPEARLALLLVGTTIAVSMPTNLFDAALWAYQRYDIRNGIDIVTVTVRTALTFYLIGNGHGLVALALLTLLTVVLGTAARIFFLFRVGPGLRIRLCSVKLETARRLYGYGVWAFLLNVARMIIPQFSPFVIGSQLGVGFVTPYNIAGRLISYGTLGLKAGTSVLTPVSATLHAAEKHGQQQRLFLEGGRYCLTLALLFATVFIVLGKSFIGLWMGPALESSAWLLTILALGEVLPMSQWVTYSIMLGMGRHKLPACVSVLENVIVITAALALAKPYGLIGVCVAVAVPGALCRGLIMVVHACRVLKVPLGTYLRRVVLPPLLAAALPVLGLVALTYVSTPASWAQLVAYGVIFVAGYAVCGLALVADARLRQRLFGTVLQFLRARRVEGGVVPGAAGANPQ